MKVLLVLLTLGILEPAEIDDWVAQTPKDTHSKLYYSAKEKKSKWVGVTDSNYRWDGDRLSWERQITDEAGRKQTVKTYKKPIEIIADIKPASTVYGVGGNIEKAVTQAFGGALTGFVWLDKVAGGGEVLLPFTADHIFKATGDRLNPVITELGADPAAGNYYVIEGSATRVFVKGFSGMGGAAGAPPNLIAHYKMNENTAGDNAELVTNGDFATDTDWNKGTGWTIAAGVAHCDGSQTGITNLRQDIVVGVTGRKYKIQFTVSNYSAGTARSSVGGYDVGISRSANGTYTDFIVPTHPAQNGYTFIVGNVDFIGDIDDISVKLCAIEDSSGNDHDGVAQQDSDAISVPGKINTALEFNGTSDYVLIPDHDDFTPASTPFSISAWVYMHDATEFTIASKGDFGADGEWRFVVGNQDRATFNVYDESASTYIGQRGSAVTGYENQWIHVVVTYDGGVLSSGIKIYINAGIYVSAAFESGTFVAAENLLHAVWLGRWSTIYADGLIDNVMLFAAELTPDEVNILYNNGAGTEIPAELDQMIRPRRANLSPLPLRRRYEY